MRSFLQEVASDLYGRYGVEVSSLHILFPTRRARHFFTDALSHLAERPMWQPHWLTIDELMREVSGLHAGERIRLIAELYKVYSAYHDEPFDKFYFWGEMLLNDFDTIDKYRVDADALFRNIYELKELEADVSYLTPGQLEVIRQFWANFTDGAALSEEKRRFLAVWRTLGAVYHGFRERLQGLGIAYGGMMQRAAADRLLSGDFAFAEQRHYVVAGFNALSACEKVLFRFLQNNAETDFYWDYDDYYLKNADQEAGMFVRENLAQFPPTAGLTHDNFRKEKELTVVSTPSNAVQCKYAGRILDELRTDADGGKRPLDKETAVVLTDENLLLPLLHSLPAEAGGINVTMGYPLKSTLAYAFLERLIELQAHRREGREGTSFYHVDVSGILAHPYVAQHAPQTIAQLRETMLSDRRIRMTAAELAQTPLLGTIFAPAAEWRGLSDYLLHVVEAVARASYDGDDARQRVEFLAVIAEQLARLRNSLDACDIELTTSIYTSLLRRHLQTVRTPFEGEPLEGVQVMGILETRNLDFRNVVLLSMNDDNFPGNRVAQSSFIPYNLRAAFDLPTPAHHEGVYAYYFYRLVQRAECIYMLYCAHADEKTTGEQSHYIYQLDFETAHRLRRVEVGVDVNLAENPPVEVAKEGDVWERLARFVAAESPAKLSPTAFFRYVACPLRFYFYSVARLKADDSLSEEVDAPMFGTILHAAAQRLYGRIEGEQHPGETLRALAASGAVEQAVTAAIGSEYLQKESADAKEYTGNLMLVHDIVSKYLRHGVVAYDAAHDGFRVEGLEREVETPFAFPSAGRELRVVFGGVADRIDRLDDGRLRVVDYKTGESHLEFAGVGALFNGEAKQRQSNVLQTLLYAMMLTYAEGRETVPALYYVRRMNRSDYSPELIDRSTGGVGESYPAYAADFERLLREKLAELFDPAVPFRATDDTEHTCRYCDYRQICRR
ncbi:PD-(D/E)XK nuclease family protein [Alistipes sp.]|uniref:PD-(D/E)XK nuclease family protein n=1 Tax=Alistipes sp. TaxID=1872444 RepID=UPI003A88C675